MDKYQRDGLHNLHENKDFQFLQGFKDEVIKRWNAENVVGDNEFETLRLAFQKEYRVKGLEEFFDLLYKVSYDDDAKF
jgi:hypothetical protein